MPLVRLVRLNPEVVDGLDELVHRLRVGPSNVPLCAPDDRKQASPFFIIGAGRSGSTLLRRLLMERYEVIIPPEMPHLGPLIRAFRRSRFADWDEAVEWYLEEFRRRADVDVERRNHEGVVFDYNLWETLDLDIERLSETLRNLPASSRSLAGLLTATYLASGGCFDEPSRAWGDKTPYSTFHYTRILRVWPRARFVHLIRDGRDYAASYLEVQRDHERRLSVRQVALRWRDAVEVSGRVASRVGDRLRTVRYEDLVEAPDIVVDRLARFLELRKRATPVRLTAEGLGDARMAHHRRIENPVSNASVGRYMDRLDSRQRMEVERLLGPLLRAHGYTSEGAARADTPSGRA